MENVKPKNSKVSVKKITRIGMLSAIAIFMSLTPFGYIMITPTLKVTFMHIPVIIAAITDGYAGGIIVGFIFGLTSLLINMSSIFAPVFLNPMVSIFPRIMIGIISAFAYKKTKNTAITAAAGTITNTALVLSMIYVFAAAAFANAKKIAVASLGKILIGVALTNGTFEVITAVILVTAIIRAIKRNIK